MRIETHGQQIEVTPAMREYVETKFKRLGRHFDQPLEIRAQLGIRKPDHVAEATLTLAGRTLHADAGAAASVLVFRSSDMTIPHNLDRFNTDKSIAVNWYTL